MAGTLSAIPVAVDTWTKVGTIAAVVAGATGILGVIFAGALLYRSRPECLLGPAIYTGVTGNRVNVSIGLHVVASGHWVRKSVAVTFTTDGRTLDTIERGIGPERGVGEFKGYLVYEMDRTTTPIDVDAVYRFRRGGKAAKYHGTLPPSLSG